MSILEFGSNIAVHYLRALTCAEMFLFADFYVNHPVFHNVMSEFPGSFAVIESILCFNIFVQYCFFWESSCNAGSFEYV